MKKNVKNIILVVSILLVFITGFAFVSKVYKDSAAKKDYYEIVENQLQNYNEQQSWQIHPDRRYESSLLNHRRPPIQKHVKFR